MANILGVGTGDASDVTQQLGALKTTVGDASSGLVKDVSDNTADIATLQADVMQADNNATNAKQAAENAYPKTGGALDGIINPNQSSGNLDNVIAQIPYNNNNIIGVEAKDNKLSIGFVDGSKLFTAYSPTIIRGVSQPVRENDVVNLEYLNRGIPKTLGISNANYAIICATWENEWLSSDRMYIGCNLTVKTNLSSTSTHKISNCVFNGCVITLKTKSSYIKFENCKFFNCIITSTVQYSSKDCYFIGCILDGGGMITVDSSTYLACIIDSSRWATSEDGKMAMCAHNETSTIGGALGLDVGNVRFK